MQHARQLLVLASLVSGLAASPALVAAQTYVPDSAAQNRHAPGPVQYNPNEGVQPNGCVKLCPLDQNPCDPPEFKRADGRCNLKD